MYAHTHTHTHTHTRVHTHTHMHIYACAHKHALTFTCTCTCAYVWLHLLHYCSFVISGDADGKLNIWDWKSTRLSWFVVVIVCNFDESSQYIIMSRTVHNCKLFFAFCLLFMLPTYHACHVPITCTYVHNIMVMVFFTSMYECCVYSGAACSHMHLPLISLPSVSSRRTAVCA